VQQALASINPYAVQLVVPPDSATKAIFWPEVLDLPRALMKPANMTCSVEPAPIATASLAFHGSIERDALEAWLDHTISLFGPMLLRMKAMLDVEDTVGPTVLHVVQGLLHCPADLKTWPGNDPQNRIVLIGRDIEEQILMDALARLAATVKRPGSTGQFDRGSYGRAQGGNG
jgi:hypothetical protein